MNEKDLFIKDKERGPKSGFATRLNPDPTPAGGSPPASPLTTRTAYCVVVNQWGEQITQVTLRHRYQNDPNFTEEHTWPSLNQGEQSSPPLKVTYQTGFGAGRDYWWTQFTDAQGFIWTCKQNFYCNLKSEDDGQTIYFFLNGNDENMYIQMISPGCWVSLYEA
jgi:Up-Regulated in long-lived daf-2